MHTWNVQNVKKTKQQEINKSNTRKQTSFDNFLLYECRVPTVYNAKML